MQISEIKSSLSILEVLSHYGFTPDRNHRLCCPWHDDKTPSLQIYPKTNTWTCFSSNCKAGSGDVIEMVWKMEQLRNAAYTKHQAILKCKSLIGNPAPAKPATPKPSVSEKVSIPDQVRIAVLTKYYQATLTAMPRSKRAMAYAKDRGLEFARLGIGYSGADIGRKWNTNLHRSAEAIGVFKQSHLKDAKGEKGYRPKFKYCLLFAMKNALGQVVDVYGRSIMNKENAKHFYLSGTQQGLYPQYPKSDTRKLILTESIIDASTLNQDPEITKDFTVLALYGTKGFTQEHAAAIKSLELLQEVIFFMDGDEAGRQAVQIQSSKITQLCPGMKLSMVATPEGEDVNSLLQGHEPNILTHLLKERKPVTAQEDLFSSSEKSTEPAAPSIERKKVESSESELASRALLKQGRRLDTRNAELLIYTHDQLKITVLGGVRITGLDRMKVTLKIELLNKMTLPLRNSLDLYAAKQVDYLAEMMAGQLTLRSSQALEIIRHLTSALEAYRQRRLEALKPKPPKLHEMTPNHKEAAMSLLRDPQLMVRTRQMIQTSGIVGEECNSLIGYIINLSRKCAKPLHVMYLGSSGSGKTHVQEGLASLVPREDRIEATSLSDQSLYYEGRKLKGKILFIEDIDGAENVMYIIRELQSKGRIIKRVAWRDNKGHTQTIEVTAEGPVVISSCTTREKVYEDNANRCILLHIDESKSQDKRVMDYLKEKSQGIIQEHQQNEIRELMQNTQRLLNPIKVYNPYAKLIDLPSEVFKPRRSLPLLLGFIETVTFYHQHQRKIKTAPSGEKYIESSYSDIEVSFDLLKHVLFSKSDELSGAARGFLEKLKETVASGETFYTKDIRKKLRVSATTMKRHIVNLQRHGYIKISAGSRYRGFEYQITDYGEYTSLKSSIQSRLDGILLKIKELSASADPGVSGPVDHQWTTREVDHLTTSPAGV